MQEKTRTRERAARKRGPAPFRPTAAQRREPMLLMAGGIRGRDCGDLPAFCELPAQTFAHELLHGRAQKRAENLRRLEAAAQGGAVTAMRVLHLVYDKADAQDLHARTTAERRSDPRGLRRNSCGARGGHGRRWGVG